MQDNLPQEIQNKLREIADELQQKIDTSSSEFSKRLLYREDRERLQNSIREYLKVTNISIVIAATFGVLCFVVAASTGFNLFKQEKIAFNYPSVITATNFCLSIYNFFCLPKLVAQRLRLQKELSELEESSCIN